MSKLIITNLCPEIEKNIKELAKAVAIRESQDFIPTPLISKELFQKRQTRESEEVIIDCFERFAKGTVELILVLNQLGKTSSDISNQITKICEGLGKIVEEPGNGKSLREICKFSNEWLKIFNQSAAFLYESKEYERSSLVYFVLSFIDPEETAFLIGWGNSEYFCKNYENALKAYQAAIEITPTDLRGYLYSCHCYLAMKEKTKATAFLEKALGIIQENSDLKEWLPRVKALKNAVSSLR
jgi:tetratricopeptide (TPR) repeat protein